MKRLIVVALALAALVLAASAGAAPRAPSVTYTCYTDSGLTQQCTSSPQVGNYIVVSGCGYSPGSTVSVHWTPPKTSSSGPSVSNPLADSTGCFSTSAFYLDVAGNYTVSVKIGKFNSTITGKLTITVI